MGAKHHEGGWTEARVALLRKMWIEGKSAEEIRLALGQGVSRPAVIGKIHRLGIHKERSPAAEAKAQALGRKRSGETRTRAPRPAPKPKALPGPSGFNPGGIPTEKYRPAKVEGDGEPLNLSLVDLPRHGCKWPVNDGKPQFLFCGHPRFGESPYCRGHAEGGVSAAMRLARHSPKELARSVRRFV